MSDPVVVKSAAILLAAQGALALANGFVMYRRKDARIFLPPALVVFQTVTAPLAIVAWLTSVAASFFVYPWFWVLAMFLASRILLGMMYHPVIAHFDQRMMEDALRGMRGGGRPDMGWLSLSYIGSILYLLGFLLLAWWVSIAFFSEHAGAGAA